MTLGDGSLAALLAASPTWADEAIFGVLLAQLVLLAVAGFFGWLQLREQIRPFVFIDFDDRYPPFIQFVIENVGATMARDVRFKFKPHLQSTFDTKGEARVALAGASLFRDGIPSFPPAKRFVVLFDNEVDRREKGGLADRLEVELSYTGRPFGRRFTDTFVLDIETYRWWGQVRRKDSHDVAKEIEKLRKLFEERVTPAP